MPHPTTIFITGAACISPQPTLAGGVGEAPAAGNNRLRCIEPDYKTYIDLRLIRRMSRVVKMGTAAAVACLRDAGVTMPGAILTGTAYGCVEDTEAFLQRMIAQNEEMLTPTAFIQSTHNTIGGQIALLLQCHAYNNTYVHRAFSFEHALLDALSLLREDEAATALVGGVDEMPDVSFDILSRFNLYKKPEAESALPSAGAVAGEGAAFFLLNREKTETASARLLGVGTWYKPADMATEISAFLQEHGLAPGDVDLLLLGKNGDRRYDGLYDTLTNQLFADTPTAGFKHLCGEYPVATAFATWLAAGLFKGANDAALYVPALPRSPKHILIYNHFYNIHHSLILLGAC